jgi:hypothetical protein
MAASDVDDAQTAKAEGDEFVAKDAAIIGSAVSDAIRHGPNQIAVYDSICGKEACDAAHFGRFN